MARMIRKKPMPAMTPATTPAMLELEEELMDAATVGVMAGQENSVVGEVVAAKMRWPEVLLPVGARNTMKVLTPSTRLQ